MEDTYNRLKERLAEVSDLEHVGGLLAWDQQTMMPSRGAEVRAEQMATIARLGHERFTDPEIGKLLEALTEYEASLPPDSDEASLIRVTRRDWDKARRVPNELAAELAHAAASGYAAWLNARANSDFAGFLPDLERNIELKRKYAACFEGAPYDALDRRLRTGADRRRGLGGLRSPQDRASPARPACPGTRRFLSTTPACAVTSLPRASGRWCSALSNASATTPKGWASIRPGTLWPRESGRPRFG